VGRLTARLDSVDGGHDLTSGQGNSEFAVHTDFKDPPVVRTVVTAATERQEVYQIGGSAVAPKTSRDAVR
jgi:hypothetical protein